MWKLFEHVYRQPAADRKLNPGLSLGSASGHNVLMPCSGVRTAQNTREPEARSVVKDEFRGINLSADPHLIKAHFLKHWVNGNHKLADHPGEAKPEGTYESASAVKS